MEFMDIEAIFPNGLDIDDALKLLWPAAFYILGMAASHTSAPTCRLMRLMLQAIDRRRYPLRLHRVGPGPQQLPPTTVSTTRNRYIHTHFSIDTKN